MNPALLFMVGLAAAALARPGSTHADPIAAANEARMSGCGASRQSGAKPALERSAALQHAASLLSQGISLHRAMRSAGYLAAQSSALHFSGTVNDSQMSQILADNYCATLTNTQLREIGAARRGQDVWLVLAAPAFVPTTADATAISREVLKLVNQARAAGAHCGKKYFAAVPPLAQNSSLGAAALTHSQNMAMRGAFDHVGGDGSTPQLRVERAGYGQHRIVGENIAAGAMTAAQVVAGWLASPPHCENIMDGRFIDTGIAFALNLRGAEAVYWTEDFAAPRQ